MERQTIDVTVNDDTFIASYLTLFAHGLKLTNKELEVLTEILKVYLSLKDKVNEPYLSELVLSTDRRLEIRENLKIEESNFNNIISEFRKKKIFTEDKGLNPVLVPHHSLVFNFNYENNTSLNSEVLKEKNIKNDNVSDIVNILEEDEEDSGEYIYSEEDEIDETLEDKHLFTGEEFKQESLMAVKIGN